MLKKYNLVLVYAILQTITLFSAQADSEDRKSKLLRALEKVESAAAKVQEPGAVIAYELPVTYERSAKECMKIVLGNDGDEEYDQLRAALEKRSPTPDSKEVVERLHVVHETMQTFEYVHGMENIFKSNQTLPSFTQSLLKKYTVSTASEVQQDQDISDEYEYVDLDVASLDNPAIVSENVSELRPSSCVPQ